MGYAEVDGLNQAARAVLAAAGSCPGPALSCGGRVFQAGERVIALRRLSGDLPRGSLLEVVAVDAAPVNADRQPGQGTRVTVDRQAAAHLGYRYAVTPAWRPDHAGPLLVLGPPGALGPHQGRVMAAAVAAPRRRPGQPRARALATGIGPPTRGRESGRTRPDLARDGRIGRADWMDGQDRLTGRTRSRSSADRPTIASSGRRRGRAATPAAPARGWG